jgi:hypothetical protein
MIQTPIAQTTVPQITRANNALNTGPTLSRRGAARANKKGDGNFRTPAHSKQRTLLGWGVSRQRACGNFRR